MKPRWPLLAYENTGFFQNIFYAEFRLRIFLSISLSGKMISLHFFCNKLLLTSWLFTKHTIIPFFNPNFNNSFAKFK